MSIFIRIQFCKNLIYYYVYIHNRMVLTNDGVEAMNIFALYSLLLLVLGVMMPKKTNTLDFQKKRKITTLTF